MRHAYPFSALVGQDAMKRAMILTAVDPGIGGVLVLGDRGTGKSTAVRALAALLPPIEVVAGSPTNAAAPEMQADWEAPGEAPGEVILTAGRAEATAWLRNNATADDVVLVKASRGAALDQVAADLLSTHADEPAGTDGPEGGSDSR